MIVIRKRMPLVEMMIFVFQFSSFIASISGRIGITTDITWPEPKSDSEDDRIASELNLEFYVSLFLFFLPECDLIINTIDIRA